MFVTCLPPRYSPHAFGTFRSISQLKISTKFHNTVLHVPFSLSLLFLLGLSHNALKKKKNRGEKKNPTDNKLKTRLIDVVARFHSNAGDE